MIAVIVLIVIVVVIVAVLAGMYNGLVKRRNQVDNSWSQIDVQLKRRHDLIPNLVEAVKDYMSYEQETLTNVTKARAAAIDAGAQGPQAVARGRERAHRHPQDPVRRGRELPGPQGQPERHAASGRADLDGEQDRLRAAVLQRQRAHLQQQDPDRSRRNLIAGMFNFTARQFFEVPEADKAVPTVDLR